MTPKEFQAELKNIAEEIGPKADLSAHISTRGRSLYCGVYPFGVRPSHGREDEQYFSVEADDFEDLLKALRARWNELYNAMRKQRIRKIAIAIIRLTAENGQCTDAALRQEFSEGELQMFAELACEDANNIASKGPFSIVAAGAANGAPDEIGEPAGRA